MENMLPQTSATVYLYRIVAEPTLIARAFASLSIDELERAKKYVFAVDQHRFALCRYALRTLLAGFFRVAPQQIEFRYGSHGRPYLQWPTVEFDFNMSHSNNWAAMALSASTQVGIDIEQRNSDSTDYHELASTVLTQYEFYDVSMQPHEHRATRFMKYWTAKEAFLKLTGTGLSQDPKKIEVTWESSYGSCRLNCADERGMSAYLTPIDMGNNAICTLATPAYPHNLVIKTYRPGETM